MGCIWVVWLEGGKQEERKERGVQKSKIQATNISIKSASAKIATILY